jgi:hypothetical protein
MAPYIRNPLTYVWAFLTAITIASWWIGRGHSVDYQLNPAVTVSVLAIAALKAQLVIRHFMEVRFGPAWLKRVAYGWVILLFLLLLAAYWARL